MIQNDCYIIIYVTAQCKGQMRNAYSILVKKPEGKRPLEISMC